MADILRVLGFSSTLPTFIIVTLERDYTKTSHKSVYDILVFGEFESVENKHVDQVIPMYHFLNNIINLWASKNQHIHFLLKITYK